MRCDKSRDDVKRGATRVKTILIVSTTSGESDIRLAKHIVRKHSLNLIDAETFVELLLHRELFPSNRYLEFGIKVECTGSLDAEVRDESIWNGVIFHLAPGHSLLIDQYETFVNGHKIIADKLVRMLHLLSGRQYLTELCLNF